MTLAFSAAIAALLLVACGSLTWYARHSANSRADTLLQAMTRKVRADQGHDPSGYADLLQDMQDDLQPNGMAMLVADSSGHVLAQSQRRIFTWPRERDDGWRVAAEPLGKDVVVIGLPWRKTEHSLHNQEIALFTLGLLVVAAAGIGAWMLVGRTLSPIGSLSRQAQMASVDSLRLNLQSPSHDVEIVDLVTTLNGLLTRVAETAAARGRFHAAASHELRTPLQALSGHLELALNRPRTNEEYRGIVQEAYTQTRRLTSLTRDLLLLHQLDSAPPPIAEPVDLTDIVERLLTAFGPTIETQHLRLQCALPPAIDLCAPPTHAEMLLRNLIENAVKYARPGGCVCIEIERLPEATQVEIFNECAPLRDWNPEKLFEPLYRPDASRNARTGGTGLGLAICRAIAGVNGWRVTLHQEPDGVRAKVAFLHTT
jgi:signal transduction histidine kinase